jgi:hypothetical protein
MHLIEKTEVKLNQPYLLGEVLVREKYSMFVACTTKRASGLHQTPLFFNYPSLKFIYHCTNIGINVKQCVGSCRFFSSGWPWARLRWSSPKPFILGRSEEWGSRADGAASGRHFRGSDETARPSGRCVRTLAFLIASDE